MTHPRQVRFNPAVNTIFYTPPHPATPLPSSTQPQAILPGSTAPVPYVGSQQAGAGSGLDAMGGGQHSVYSATNSFSHYQYSVQAPYGQVGHDATIPAQSAYTPLTTQVTAPYPVDPSLIASLSRFPTLWDVRARGLASLASEPLLDAFAFEDGAKSCLLFFAVPGANDFRTERWVALQQPVRVRDIIIAIDHTLFEPRPPSYIPKDHPAFPGAIAARQYRTADNCRGPDPQEIVWRRVDAWPGQALYFRGLQRIHPTERRFLVLLEPAVPQ